MSRTEGRRTMSGKKTQIEKVGVANSYWGVCGFTSTFQALYQLNPGRKGLVHGAGIATRVLAEIKTYLVTLKAEGKLGLLQEIETFTRAFPPTQSGTDFSTFRIDNYIKLINQAVGRSNKELRSDELHSIGMPPRAVVDYLDRMWQKKATLSLFDTGTNGIIGVKRDNRPMYGGLCHYMYRFENKIYSWGNNFNSVQKANPNYTVILTIAFS
jgi:hypothetical protein